TYPSSYRDSTEKGVNPNSVFEVAAKINENHEITVDSVASRAASYSSQATFDNATKSIRRAQLNYDNAKADMHDIIERMITPEMKAYAVQYPGDVYEMTIDQTSLLTPYLSKSRSGLLEKALGMFGVDYVSETKQLKDQHRALEMLNGQTITVDGV